MSESSGTEVLKPTDKKDIKPARMVQAERVADFIPRDDAQLQERAKILVKVPDMVPKDYKNKPWETLYVAMLHGLELGFYPLQALQCVMVVNGKPSVYGDAALSLVLGSGKMTDWDEVYVANYVDPKTKVSEGPAYVCTYWRVNKKKPIVQKFSMADAKTARLWGKEGPWTNYPPRMLQMRARGFGLRDGFADVMKGMIIYEEARDIVDTTAEIEDAPQELPTGDLVDERTGEIHSAPPEDAPTVDYVSDDERKELIELLGKQNIKPALLKEYLRDHLGISDDKSPTRFIPRDRLQEVRKWIMTGQGEMGV